MKWMVSILLAIALATGQAPSPTRDLSPGQRWTKISVELPVSRTSFPPGSGAELTEQCLTCHSAGMVLRQPPLTQNEWVGEINKMRLSFGAPIPADQVETLARYLYSINGRDAAAPTTVDGKSN
jgi:hypothetical protein